LFAFIVEEALFLVLVMVTAAVMHEWGHKLYFKWVLKKDVKVKWKSWDLQVGNKYDYMYLSNKHYLGVNAAGILWGVIPLAFASTFAVEAMLLFIPYIIACKQDIKNIKGVLTK